MRAAVLFSLLLLPAVAAAQVYTWKDATGKIHYTDQPPADRNVQSRRLGPEFSATQDTSAARQAAADKRLDASKKKTDAEQAAAKAAKEQADEQQRQQDCIRARNAAEGIESGRIRFRLDASGEREALEGAARDAELAEARRHMEAACGPRPAPPAAAAAPKKAPGY